MVKVRVDIVKPRLGDYPIYFYKYLINGGYYSLLFPFRISKSNKNSEEWILVGNKRQKVWTWIIFFMKILVIEISVVQ